MKITIIHNEKHGYTVIADGRICAHLSWDEMLGQVAALTLTGKAHFRSRTIGEKEYWFKPPIALLTEGENNGEHAS